jgi:hypothetical protein
MNFELIDNGNVVEDFGTIIYYDIEFNNYVLYLSFSSLDTYYNIDTKTKFNYLTSRAT